VVLYDGIGEGTGHLLQSVVPEFPPWKVLPPLFGGGGGLTLCELFVVKIFVVWLYRERDPFLIVDRHPLQRMEDAVFHNRFCTNCDDPILGRFQLEGYRGAPGEAVTQALTILALLNDHAGEEAGNVRKQTARLYQRAGVVHPGSVPPAPDHEGVVNIGAGFIRLDG